MKDSKIIERNSNHVQSVGRAMQLIEFLADEKHEISLTEISKKIGWPKSTVHGLLSTMCNYQIVEQSAVTGRYKLGVRLFELGNIVVRSWDISAVAKPYMQHLNSELSAMIQLATEQNGEVLYLEKLESNQTIRIVSDVGRRLPMHCSGLGKVLLAYKPYSEAKRIISEKGLKRMTSRTITSVSELEKELKKIREQGYAIDNQEIMEGLRCVAVPIFDVDSKVNYAISVSGLSVNMKGDYLEKALSRLKETAGNISLDIGYKGDSANVNGT